MRGVPCDRRGSKPSARSDQRNVVAVPISSQAAPSVAKWWCIAGCGFTSYGAKPTDELCRECRVDLGGDGAGVGVEDMGIRKRALEAVLLGGEVIR